MVGLSIGSYDFLLAWMREEELAWAVQKIAPRHCWAGTLGGVLGGVLDWKAR